MKMKIRVLYWPMLGSQAAVLGNVQGFQHFADVEFRPIQRKGDFKSLRGRDLDSDADLIFIPDFSIIMVKAPSLFTVLQLGGRGPAEYWKMRSFDLLHRVTDYAEVVTILDTNLYSWLKEKKQPWKWNLFHIVPNGLHYSLFAPPIEKKEKSDDFTVLAPKIGGPMKSGYMFANVAHQVHVKGYKNIKFIAPVQYYDSYVQSQDIMPLEPKPYYKMSRLYNSADLILNIPPQEVLPNSAFEAFLCGKPYLTINNPQSTGIGNIQTVAIRYLEQMRNDFGISVDTFHEIWKDKYWTGDHFMWVKSAEEIVTKVIELYEHPDLREKVCAKAREWALKFNWSWKDKCRLILELARNQGWWG